MNSTHEDYPELIHSAVKKMREVVKEEYQPYVENAPTSDIVHYELHVVCSFLMNFLLKLVDNSHFITGEKMTIDHAYDEFTRIFTNSLKDWKEQQEEVIEH